MNFFMSCYRRKCRDSNPDTAFAMDVLAGHWDTITPHLPGAVHRIRTCRSFPTNCFQDSSLTSPDIRHILVNNLRQLSLFFGWRGGTWTPRDRKASWFTVSAATNYGIPANIGRCDGSRTHTNIHSTTSEAVLYTSSSTHRKSYNTFYIIHSTPNECQCQAFLKSYLKKRIITFEYLKLRFSGVALCQKHRKRPLVSWITRSKRP